MARDLDRLTLGLMLELAELALEFQGRGLSHNRYNATSRLLCFARIPRAAELASVDVLFHDQPATNITQASADVEYSLKKDVFPFTKTARERWLVEQFDWLLLDSCSCFGAMFHV